MNSQDRSSVGFVPGSSDPNADARSVIRVLLVDDDDDIRLLQRILLKAANDGLTVSGEATSGSEALAQLDDVRPTVVVLDHMMPEISGLETAVLLRQRRPGIPIVLFTAYLTPDLESRAAAQGVDACLSKTNVNRLPDLVRRLAEAA